VRVVEAEVKVRTGDARTKRRSLVTGGSGFIGQHLVAALLGRGDFVRVLDLRPPPSHAPVEFVQGSILDGAAVRRAMDGIDTVYHLAAICHMWTPDRRDYDRVNHIGTRVVLEAAAEKRIQRFIHCSTEAIVVRQAADASYVDGTLPAGVEQMVGPYTRSKFLAEQAVRDAANNGFPATIVNPTAPIGPGDHNFTPPTAMLSMFLRHPPLFLVDCVLNFVDVRDVATGILLAGERGRIGERYMLGGEDVSVRDLFADVARMSDGRTYSFAIPGKLALGVGKAAEWFANNVSHRKPLATAEAVRLGLRSAPVDMRKTCTELGYSPRPIKSALVDAVAWLTAQNAGVSDPTVRRPAGIPQHDPSRIGPTPAGISARRR
jgi:nucleoside-diphosphate-sugar epimerase